MTSSNFAFLSLPARLIIILASPVAITGKKVIGSDIADNSNEGKSCRFFDLLLQKGEKGFKKFQLFFSLQTGDTFFTIAVNFFVKVWRINDNEISFFF